MNEDFIIRLFIHLLVSLLLIRGSYFHFNRHYAHASAFIAFGCGVFIVTAMLHNTQISMGFAFGLFAVFSMLRYRTESISVKEMTYLFLTIALSLLNAVATLDWLPLLATDLFIVAVAFVLETSLIFDKQEEREVDYDLIDNIRPENQRRLIADLKARTGWQISSVDILEVDFIRDRARLRVSFPKTTKSQRDSVCQEASSRIGS